MKNELTLFEIAQEYRRITDVLMDTGVDEQTLSDTLEGEAWPLEQKVQNYGFVIRNMQATAAAIKAAEEQMAARRAAIDKRVVMLTERLKEGLQLAGVSTLPCPHFVVSIKNNPPAVDVFDATLVPESFWVQPETPAKVIDKKAIGAALKAGADVPGAKQVRGNRIEIK